MAHVKALIHWGLAQAWWLAPLSLASFIGSLLLLPVLVAAIPQDYFVAPPEHGRRRAARGAAWLVGIWRRLGGGHAGSVERNGDGSPAGAVEPLAWFLWLLFHLAKNLAGLVLLLVGLIMLITPGQGLLTCLMGVLLLDFPGKRRLELWLVQRRAVARSIAWLRQRAGVPPLCLPESGGSGGDR